MTLSDASVTKWELPDLFAQRSPSQHSGGAQASAKQSSAGQGERDSGFEQGRKEGLEAGQSEIREKLETLDNIIESLSVPMAQADNQIARELIQLSVRLAETIIHREVDLQPELIERQVAEALATLTSKSADISIRMHPEDARVLKECRLSGSDASESEEAEYRIVPDASLHRGGCVLQTPTTLVDATIEKQLRDLLSEMLDSAADQ